MRPLCPPLTDPRRSPHQSPLWHGTQLPHPHQIHARVWRLHKDGPTTPRSPSSSPQKTTRQSPKKLRPHHLPTIIPPGHTFSCFSSPHFALKALLPPFGSSRRPRRTTSYLCQLPLFLRVTCCSFGNAVRCSGQPRLGLFCNRYLLRGI